MSPPSERYGRLLDEELPFLSCGDLAVFTAFSDRTRDWADLEAMVAAGSLDGPRVIGDLVTHLGASDPRVVRLAALLDRGS